MFNNQTQEFEEIPGEGPIIEGEAQFIPEMNPMTGETELRFRPTPLPNDSGRSRIPTASGESQLNG